MTTGEPQRVRRTPRPTGTFEYRTAQERPAIAAAVAFVSPMHQLALSAPSGQVLAACEQHPLDQGRQLLRDTVAKAGQVRVDHAEQKGGTPASAAAASSKWGPP